MRVSAWPSIPADDLSTTTSLAPASPPTRISASRVVLDLPHWHSTMIRHGCSRLATLAASIDGSGSAVTRRDHA